MLHTTKIKICGNFLFYKSILYYYSTCIFGNVCHPIAFRSQICGMVFAFLQGLFLVKTYTTDLIVYVQRKSRKKIDQVCTWQAKYIYDIQQATVWKKSTMHNRSKTMDLHHTHKTTHKKCRVHIFCEMLDHIMHTVQ